MEEKTTDAPFRAKICIGHNEVLSTWAAVCPKCNEAFRLLWPFWVLQIPLHRVVDLRCPFCRYAFSLVAGTLTGDDGDQLMAGLVEGLS
jgi:hypothetical protein